MASRTAVSSSRRNRKLSTRGKARKRLLRSKGTTPKFAIHVK